MEERETENLVAPDKYFSKKKRETRNSTKRKRFCKLSYYESLQIIKGLRNAESKNEIASEDSVIATSDFAIPFESQCRC